MDASPFGVFDRYSIGEDLDLFVWDTEKFKGRSVRLVVQEPLDDRASCRALVANILRRSCARYPDLMSLSRRLESLFGASLSVGVMKVGEQLHTTARLWMVNDRLVSDSAGGSFADAIHLLSQVLTDPVEVDGAVPQDTFEIEQQNLIRAVESVFDDKAVFAQHRLLQEMYGDEPYARQELGEVGVIGSLDRLTLLDEHRQRLSTAPLRVYAVGDFRGAAADELEPLLNLAPRGKIVVPPPVVRLPVGESREKIDVAQITQSKLLIGYRIRADELGHQRHYALGLFNVILGGGSSASRLFRQVREERGLAYYAYSGIDRLKGLLYLSAGVSAKDWELAAEVMRDQVGAMKRGEFSDEELEVARSVILNGLASINDSAAGAIDFVSTAEVANRLPDVDEVASVIRSLGREDVVAAAEMSDEDTLYLLKGTEENAA